MHINNQDLEGLSIVGYAEPHDSLAFGVNKSSSHLIKKLNFAIERIPEEKKVAIYKQWNNVKVRESRNYSVLLLCVVFVLIVLIGLIYPPLKSLNDHNCYFGVAVYYDQSRDFTAFIHCLSLIYS